MGLWVVIEEVLAIAMFVVGVDFGFGVAIGHTVGADAGEIWRGPFWSGVRAWAFHIHIQHLIYLEAC